jgi:NADPH:quinone reductase-like Zn-dependent oxidoreductase/acyl carrier protein
VGEAVTGLRVGDEVLALALGCLASHVVADVRLVVPKPSHLGFEEGATVPIAFVTAHYALHHLARLQPGERVLIHAAAGGVGLAALRIAQRVGAEVFATAGSAEKREFLTSLGVRHVMDSRSLAFADEVREATEGEGVDVVVNSLAGEAVARSLEVLRPFGRFLEIGKRDIHGNALSLVPFHKGLSFFAIDLERMIRERPAFAGHLLGEVMAHFERGVLSPLPLRTFPVGELAGAFRHMAQACHTGKIVLRVQGEDPAIEAAVPPAGDLSQGTYLITGGLGGLGLRVARWLASRGARHLALVDRRGLTLAATEAVEDLNRTGVQVRVIRADVADEAQVTRALEEVDETMPPLQGVVHAAAIFDDATVLHLDRPRLEAVMAPKLAGAWNLHNLTAGRTLDLFVFFSSVSSMLGLRGQASDAAGNAFLDALAVHRRARGLPASTINWGPWSDKGLLQKQSVPVMEGASTSGAVRVEPVTTPEVRSLDESTYVVKWPSRRRRAHSDRPSQGPGSWLILADRTGVGAALARLLRERGETSVMVYADEAGSAETPGRAFLDGWKSEGVPRRGVVHLWSLDAPQTDELTPASLEAAHTLGCVSTLQLVRALAAAGGPRLWLVTRGAQPAGGLRSPLAVAQAPLWGFGRVLALEQPECWGGLVDLDPGADAVQRLMEEITQPDGEDQVAFRGEERRVARLVREPLRSEAPARLSDGTYLVTGGLGGLGLQVARWLVERGGRHLVLMSRAGLPERPLWEELTADDRLRARIEAVRGLEALGASVTVAAADVSDPAAMASVFAAFGRTLPPLRGVVHAAGVMTVSALTELEVPALLDVLRPKVTGAWVLHELTRELELDLFVMFSSAAAVWGSKAFAHYAAANQFLDALAHHRRARGLPGLSVNWGWWSGGGMTSAETEAFFRRVGLGEMSSAQTLVALGQLLADGSVQKTVASVDWDLFKLTYEAWGPRPLLQDIETGASLDRDRGAQSTRRGLGSLTTEQGLLAFERILRARPLQMGVMSFDLRQWRASHPATVSSPLLSRLSLEPGAAAAAGPAAPPSVGEALLAIEPGRRRRGRLESHLRERVAQVLRLAPSRVDVNKPFRALGLDSLMALELRNRLETDLGLKLPATLVWNHPTVTALVPHLADRMGIPLEAAGPETSRTELTGGEHGIARVLDEIEQLSSAEARRLLAEGVSGA